jgi:hypothetical protein
LIEAGYEAMGTERVAIVEQKYLIGDLNGFGQAFTERA